MRINRAALFAYTIASIAALVAGSAQAARTDLEVESLRGLDSLYLIVQSPEEDLADDGLTKDMLRSDVRKRIENAGIKIVYDTKNLGDDGAILLVAVSLVRSDSGVYAANIDAELIQVTTLSRDPNVLVPATTWTSGMIVLLDESHVLELRARVGKLVDEFIQDYRSANLPISGKPKIS
ncbi:MAG: hypothetical protein M1133_00850 [Armatimonadetes bacterium]|nr:hypothetical protein [Armatimonadota bacterium]